MNTINHQFEMPFLSVMKKPKYADRSIVESLGSYREAVIYAWEHRVNTGAGERVDQAICANLLGMHTPHMSRCVNRSTKAPMDLKPDFINAFESFTGWHIVSQYLAHKSGKTFMEQILEERKSA